MRRRRVEHKPKPCEGCAESFTPKRADARYCSSPCRQRAYRERKAIELGRLSRLLNAPIEVPVGDAAIGGGRDGGQGGARP